MTSALVHTGHILSRRSNIITEATATVTSWTWVSTLTRLQNLAAPFGRENLHILMNNWRRSHACEEWKNMPANPMRNDDMHTSPILLQEERTMFFSGICLHGNTSKHQTDVWFRRNWRTWHDMKRRGNWNESISSPHNLDLIKLLK